MIIDAHGHACSGYATLESLLNELNKNKIEKVILFPAEIGKDKIDKIPDFKSKNILYFSNVIGKFLTRFFDLSQKIDFGNSYVYYLKLLAPQRIIQFYQLTPKYLYKMKSDFEKMKYSGIKLHQCVKYFSINSDFFNCVIDFAEEKELPIVIHLSGRKDALDIIEVAKKRNIKIIIAHLLFYKLFVNSWDSIKDNIYFDLANYYFVNKDSINKAIKYFGCNKLIFGTDNPFGANAISKTIDMINNLQVTPKEKEMIFSGNIQEILKM